MIIKTKSEENLVRGAIDTERFLENVSAMKKTMYGMAYSLLGNAADCEDAAQSAIFKAYRALDRLEDMRSFKPWFLKILKNECFAILRRRRPTAELAAWTGSYDCDAVTGIDLRRAFGRLSPVNRATFWLYHVEGYSIAETAKITGAPAGTVKSRLSRTRAELRKGV